MTGSFSFEFTPTREDYVNSYREFQLGRRNIKLLFGASALLELCLVGALISNISNGFWGWAFVVPLPLLYFYFWVWTPNLFGRQVEGDERLFVSIRWQLDEREIVIKNQFSQTRHDWGDFQGFFETREFFFLIQSVSKGTFNFIPKRAFASPSEEGNFREIIRRNIKGEQKPLRGKKMKDR